MARLKSDFGTISRFFKDFSAEIIDFLIKISDEPGARPRALAWIFNFDSVDLSRFLSIIL